MTPPAVWVTIGAGGANMAVVNVLEGFHPLTVDEYVRLAGSPSWDRTELIGGVVYDMSPRYDLHAGTIITVGARLLPLFPERVRSAGSVQLDRHTMVEPDVYVLQETAVVAPDGWSFGHQLHLAVEICVSSHSRDLHLKLPVYAGAGVPEYWVVDPRPGKEVLLRHTRPADRAYEVVQSIPVGVGARDLDPAAILGI